MSRGCPGSCRYRAQKYAVEISLENSDFIVALRTTNESRFRHARINCTRNSLLGVAVYWASELNFSSICNISHANCSACKSSVRFMTFPNVTRRCAFVRYFDDEKTNKNNCSQISKNCSSKFIRWRYTWKKSITVEIMSLIITAKTASPVKAYLRKMKLKIAFSHSLHRNVGVGTII